MVSRGVRSAHWVYSLVFVHSLVFSLIFSLVLSIVICAPSFAQATRPMTLEDCIALALRNGPTARAASLTFAESEWGYRSYNASLRPILSLGGNLPGVERSIGEVTRDDGTVAYVEQNRTSSSFDLSLDQAIPQTGATLSLGSSLTRTDEFGDVDRTLWQSTPLSIQLSQPLFRFNSQGWDRKVEPKRYDLARRSYLWDLEGVAVQVTDLFFRFYVADLELQNAETNAAVNDSIYQLSLGRFEIGNIAENDLLQSELALTPPLLAVADVKFGWPSTSSAF